MSSGGFEGKTVVITGAGRGLGAAFAITFADLKARVIMAGRNLETLSSTAEAIYLRCGTRPEILKFDLADPGEVTRTAKKMRDEMQHIDILINNGAQWLPGKMTEHDAYDIVGTIGSAVTGTLLFSRGLVPLLEASGAGDILNIISISGLPNVPLHGASVAFLAAKHGQTGMTDGLRQELRGRPVRVSALFPPVIDDLSPLEEAWNSQRPAGSRATSRDIVETGLFALSRPRNVTLASIVIDPDAGGLHE
jgi:NADP-dependent 3-hydroxy acid dehydrogenase YdfG